MNRIKEIRESQGLTQADLAERIGTAQSTVFRLETGQRKLTVDWMQKIARVLGVEPADLIQAAHMAGLAEDAEPYVSEDAAIAPAALAQRGLAYFRVKSDAVARAGVVPGAVILIDMTPEAVRAVTTGDIVVAQAYDADNLLKATTIVRQFIAPSLLVTNRAGTNTAVDIETAPLDIAIKGVRVRD